ncbi:hypothetical protein IPG41_00065 [Candidatus Peregrinibacteria bacterium]|nr:MAG: hypothetical protein IPG41_00065 [Candidatus Peregrinibacteria bacterium]
MTETLQMPAPTPAKDGHALVAYIGPLFIWTMMKHGDNPSYVWHAKNAAGIFAVDVAIYLVLQILAFVMPIGMLGLFGLIFWAARVLMTLMTLFALWQAWNGKQAVLPLASGIGQKIPLEKWFHKSPAAPAASVVTPVAVSISVASPAPSPEPVTTPTPVEPAPTPEPTPAPMPEAVKAPEAPVATAPMPAPEAPKPVEPTPPAAPTV